MKPINHSSTPAAPTRSSAELTQTKLAMSLFGPKVSPGAARQSARRLIARLDTPSALEHLSLRNVAAPGATLCRPSAQKPILGAPTALFSQRPLSVSDIPESWLAAYARWMERLGREQEFGLVQACLKGPAHEGVTVTDPVVAGLLLYLWSAAIDPHLRAAWRQVALESPAGAWLAAEALHPAEERQATLDAVRKNSRLLWWTSQLPGFGRGAVKHARAQLDLYGGLVLAVHGRDGELAAWLQAASIAACARPEAACAMLVLQPEADHRDKACWLASLENPKAAPQAYETLRWARHAWPGQAWEKLKLLRPYVVGDRGQWFFHWFRDIEPEGAQAALGAEGLDPLWGAELLETLGAGADDYAFRFRLGERLGSLGSPAASLVLDWLNCRLERKNHGTAL
jgi:hypothetical protein